MIAPANVAASVIDGDPKSTANTVPNKSSPSDTNASLTMSPIPTIDYPFYLWLLNYLFEPFFLERSFPDAFSSVHTIKWLYPSLLFITVFGCNLIFVFYCYVPVRSLFPDRSHRLV